jgi:two-component system chemotaxis sensor kinase CheA
MSSTGFAGDAMSDAVFDHLKSTYFQECAELLESAYGDLTALEEGRADAETVHGLFRAIHSIKGSGGVFGFSRMVSFAHSFETLLDLLRSGKISADRTLVSLLLRATDMLADLIAAERTGTPAAAGVETALLAALDHAASLLPCQSVAPQACSADAAVSPERPTPPQNAIHNFRIGVQPHAGLFKNASEPLLLMRELQRLGTTRVIPDLTRLPALDALDAEAAYIGWTIELATTAALARVEEIFEFINDQCDLTIEPVTAQSAPFPTTFSLDAAAMEHFPPAAEAPLKFAAAAVPDAKPEPVDHRRSELPASAQSVRVDVEKVDRLVNLVGELVINQAMLIQLGGLLPPELCPGLITGLETLSQHLRELQEGVMAIRTQPVKSVFSRMPRLVRELSAQLGKEARLFISGEGTEIDKTVIEQLADPLTHLLRNAIDHGIERPDERVARGKPAQGSIHLGAEHRSGRIVIEVADDGRGIDRERVLARARKRGLVAEDAQPSEEEIDHLIFLPGFSTAETVSNISGRGVGMDVVRRNIQALGGRIALQSRSGAGSRFLLSLPLTLAIMDGMIVAVGRESYIVPLTNIVESLRPRLQDIHAVAGSGDVVAIRGQYVPLLYLARHFGVPNAVTDAALGIVVVVEGEGAGQVGLVVDELLGQQQVVVKSLEANYGDVRGIGGATILGNGRVALILDIAGLHTPSTSGRPSSGDVRRFGGPGSNMTLQ